jgi:hypothetical protein
MVPVIHEDEERCRVRRYHMCRWRGCRAVAAEYLEILARPGAKANLDALLLPAAPSFAPRRRMGLRGTV